MKATEEFMITYSMLKNKSKFVKSVYDNKKLLAIFVKKSFFKYIDQTTFLTGNKELFQMGFIRKNNELYKPIFILIAKNY